MQLGDSDSDDEDVIRTKVPAVQSTVEAFSERVLFAFKQVYHDFETAETSADALKALSTRAAMGAASLKEGIETNVPGGTKVLKMVALAGPIVGGPVVSAIALSAATAVTVADQADNIEAGANVINALDFGAKNDFNDSKEALQEPIQAQSEPSSATQSSVEVVPVDVVSAAPAPESSAQSYTPGYGAQLADYASATLSSFSGWFGSSDKNREAAKVKVS